MALPRQTWARFLLSALRVAGHVAGWHWARAAAGCGKDTGPVPGLCLVGPELVSAFGCRLAGCHVLTHRGGGHISSALSLEVYNLFVKICSG